MPFTLFGSAKKTTNTTINETDVFNADNRVAASEDSIALGQGSALDQSIVFTDESDHSTNLLDQSNRSVTDNSDRRVIDSSDRRIIDQSDRSVTDSRSFYDQSVTNLEVLDDDVALGALGAARELSESAVSLVNSGLIAQAESARQTRLLSENALGIVADTTRKNLLDTLAVVDSQNARSISGILNSSDRALSIVDGSSIRAFELARELGAKGQEESAAARSSASETIKEVLGFKEAGDTKVAESLIKYGAIAAALLAAALLFRGRRPTA